MALEDPNNIEKEKPAVAQEPAAETEYGAVKKKIKIPGFGEIEYTEKRVMFLEKTVQETGGVKGYIRKMISWEELLRFWGIDESEWEKIKAGQIYHSREELEKDNKRFMAEKRPDLLYGEETLNEHPKRESIEKFKQSQGVNAIALALTKN